MLRQFDCHLRICRFAKLFVIVDYLPNRRMWEAYIYNATAWEIPKAPVAVVRSSYQDLINNLATYELIEQRGGLR